MTDDDDDSFDRLSLSQQDSNDHDNKVEFAVEPTPDSQRLIAKITENYVFGKEVQTFTIDEILALIEKEFRIRKVPVQIGEAIFDADETGIALDESVTQILSFAAYHGLPKRLTAELLDDSLGDPFSTAKKVFLKEGWKSVNFPKGLAIQPLGTASSTSSASSSSRRRQRGRWKWWDSRQERIQEAMRAVQAAAAARSPIRQLQAPKDFLAKFASEDIVATSHDLTAFGKINKQIKDMPFFPNNIPVPKVSWKRLQLAVERASSKIKQKGKAGLLAYALFNFLFYSVGMLWQWSGVASATVTSSSSALNLTLRKFVRVFTAVFIVSNILKIPRLLTIGVLIPWTERLLKQSSDKTGLSEKKCLMLFVSALVLTWVGILAVPVGSEFFRLRKLIFLESVFDQYVAEPVAHLTVV